MVGNRSELNEKMMLNKIGEKMKTNTKPRYP
jgi:hypothetical protein